MPRIPEAATSSGDYSYELRVVAQDPEAWVIAAFKVSVAGMLQIEPSAQPFAIYTALTSEGDARLVYPGFPALEPNTFDGSLIFHLAVGSNERSLSFWDGDLDFGSFDGSMRDSDDPDTPGSPFLPQWTTPFAVPEGVAVGAGNLTGDHPDDGDTAGMGIYLVRSPSPMVQVLDPRGRSYSNLNPSGNQEWEQFRLTTIRKDPIPADLEVPSLPPGLYTVAARGIDLQNVTYWRFEHPVVCVTTLGQPCGCQGSECSSSLSP